MRHVFAHAAAVCCAIATLAVLSQPAFPAVRHIAISHEPAPPLVMMEISQTAPTVQPVAPPSAACGNCPQPGANTACGPCPQPAVVQINLVQLPL